MIALSMGKPLRVRALIAEERTRLVSMVHSKDFTRRIRASIVLESSMGSIVNRIAQKLDVNKHTARLWIRRFNESGIDGLSSRPPPGRPPTISSEQKDAIVRVALTDPRSLGMNFTTWSLSTMRSYLERNQIVRRISESWIRKILIKKGSGTSGARGGRRAATPTTTRR